MKSIMSLGIIIGFSLQASVPLSNWDLLRAAVFSNQPNLLKKVLQEKFNDPLIINKLDTNGLALLHHAAQYGNANIVKILLELKASINVEDKNGLKPIDHAVENNYKKTIKVLIDAGANVNRKTYQFGRLVWADQEILDILRQKFIEQARPMTLLGISIRARLLLGFSEDTIAGELAKVRQDVPMDGYWKNQAYLFAFLESA